MPAMTACDRCGGAGHIERFGHYAKGVCFACAGSGKVRAGSKRAQKTLAEAVRGKPVYHAILEVGRRNPAGYITICARHGCNAVELKRGEKITSREVRAPLTAGPGSWDRAAGNRLAIKAARDWAASTGATFVPWVYLDSSLPWQEQEALEIEAQAMLDAAMAV